MKLVNNSSLELGEERHGKGRYFKSKFFEPGIVSYAKQGGMVYLITKETIDKFIDTIVGCPVIIQHADVTDENVKELEVGRISRVWFDTQDGWYWCEGIIADRDAEELINQGWSVSCCYEVTDKDLGGGVWHDIEYDAEILNGDFEHLAIVPNPRYREATILLNSTEDNDMLRNLFSAKNKVKNSTKENEEMTDKKENDSVDKRKLIDEVGGMLKSWGLDEEKIRTVIGKMEKASYNDSEDDKKDNASEYEKEEDKDEVNENTSDNSDDEKEEDKEDKKENTSDDEEEDKEEKEEDKKENACKAKNSSDFDEVRKMKNSVYDVEVKTGYVPESTRLKNGAEY